jgi:ferric-dicitrate binding protein FerR (iron transport regulator)
METECSDTGRLLQFSPGKEEEIALKQEKTAFLSKGFIAVLCIIFASALSGCANQQAAPASIGTVKQIKNGALERQDSKTGWKALSQNGTIYAGDRLRTGLDGTAVLALTKVGVVLIKPNTEYTVGSDPMNFKTVLHRGYVWIKTSLTPGAKLDISAAGAVAGVRGTSVSVLSDEQGVDVCTCKGEVTVTTPKNGREMAVTSGMYGSISTDGIADAPEHGKKLLEKLWKGGEPRFTPCRDCHQKGKKATADL